ncbi:VRR-NUC domain-containing protein [Streptomyces sp. NBC_01768]|uniref:VRR-NUC domain-containing protein n=1 Tax=Streptomyces sp. NBC_01768 TaxID=2975938 RepID=UPI002DD83F9B|nr:VRR-NUC domain-containing protein [Streptomyces sp. NBC_01768]WSC32283.1 VRR-NUC domain-containing protein [Streptomyces sp. NBC_01768]
MTHPRERVIEDYLLTQCRAHGFLCLKFVSPARRGVPDRIVVALGRIVFVEVKRPGGQLRKLQQLTHAKLRRHGAEVHVVDDKPSIDVFIAHLLRTSSNQQRAAP